MSRQWLVAPALLVASMFDAGMAFCADDWVARSDKYSIELLGVSARFFPEYVASIGVEGYDENVFDLGPDIHERRLRASRDSLEALKGYLTQETDPRVRQDLEILIQSTTDNMHTAEMNHKYLLPYFNLGQSLFFGFQSLLDPQVAKERQKAALMRLQRYTGREEGYTPIVELAKARTTERLEVDGLLGPFRGEVEQDLQRLPTFVSGIKELLEKSGLEGWETSYEALAVQLNDYGEWARGTILPRSRDEARLPRELYEDGLKNWGVDASPEELIALGTDSFIAIRDEMMTLAPLVAAQHGFESTDYRDVIAELKKDTIPGDEILEFYRNRLAEIEEIISRARLVSIPDRDMAITMKTAAESAAQPAASLKVPRLVGNTGEHPEFMVPLIEKDGDGNWKQNDSAFRATSWTLSAHEARPGHELQFSAMLAVGVSIARGVFAFNSANVEGWALYAESIVKPFMPLDAQLVSLQDRLMRSARIFLDPMLNLGMISAEEAKRVLMEEVVLGDDDAQNEIERYTYRIPGQATAYYYGFTKLRSLRAEAELKLRDRFDQQAFHDFILAQGLLPPDLLRKAVMEEFVSRR